MIRVLHVIGAMDRAGAEAFLMNVYRHIDRTQVQFDFMVHADGRCDFDDEIEELGGRIFHIPRYKVINKGEYARTVRAILQEHPEDMIIHSHIGSSAPVHLKIARDESRFAIAHSHNDKGKMSFERIAFKMLSYPVRWHADHYMACSPGAGLDRFGRTITEGDSYTIIPNGIDTERYHRNERSAREAKDALGLEEAPVFGHIGRLTRQKNQAFLLDTFSLIRTQLPNARLLLIGRGEDEEKLKHQADALGISDAVSFMGVRDDIPTLLRALDVFVFPSLYEGLPVATVEVQAAGIQSVISDQISEMAVLTDRTQRIPLQSAELWADECLRAYERSASLKDDCVQEVSAAGFDIVKTAAWLQDFYLTHAPRDN